MSSTYVLGLVFSGLVLVVIFLRLRNSGMKEKYATWWIIIAVVVLLASVFPSLLSWISDRLGVAVPLNLGFFFSGIVLLFITLQYSVDLSRADERTRRLTEEIALLRDDVDQLKNRTPVDSGGEE